jgi:hypothetical protein
MKIRRPELLAYETEIYGSSANAQRSPGKQSGTQPLTARPCRSASWTNGDAPTVRINMTIYTPIKAKGPVLSLYQFRRRRPRLAVPNGEPIADIVRVDGAMNIGTPTFG